MEKELYYEKMKVYFEQGIVREVYSSDDVCIFCIGENNYVASSYILLDGNPIAFSVNSKILKRIIEDNEFFLYYQKNIIADLKNTGSLMYDFSPNNLELWKAAIQQEGLISKVDYDLEAEISGMNKSR